MSPFEEGQLAAKQKRQVSVCPYIFKNVHVSQEIFDKEFRSKVDDWFNGWNGERKRMERKK